MHGHAHKHLHSLHAACAHTCMDIRTNTYTVYTPHTHTHAWTHAQTPTQSTRRIHTHMHGHTHKHQQSLHAAYVHICMNDFIIVYLYALRLLWLISVIIIVITMHSPQTLILLFLVLCVRVCASENFKGVCTYICMFLQSFKYLCVITSWATLLITDWGCSPAGAHGLSTASH